MKTLIILVLLSLAMNAHAARQHYEKWYQQRWCSNAGGQTEKVLSDKTRVDCVTSTHAIEFDFGNKWSEAIGQSLGYAIETNKRAGIVLILESPKDYKYWIKLNSIIDHYNLPIDTWKTGGGDDN
ncbi:MULTISPECIES: hypothetical protein [unclassified Oceanobacter]|uniref:hypothetical protein n=1 Tax=unclassified Oceanobacter TaxID=2620260 RepID=UPI0027349A31|nr:MULTISPECIES: hypothetical protein [unclassified Oceanobacter]MDP2548505.1 hypothetical protein [Oceanobacter sp. 4_MG-2023]MDP2607967.1 hypothetical protein [Oceanobacter sp. 1_MG-2023]MDP2611371.1 hypothetical protein [Oceanobacter sp. 2_MG-2023]